MKNSSRYHLDAQEGLASVIRAAKDLLRLQEFIGTEEPTVITWFKLLDRACFNFSLISCNQNVLILAR